MSRSSPVVSDIPRWPKTTAELNADGSGRLTIDGRAEQLDATDIAAARAVVLERVTTTATSIGRPVRLTSTDPDGEWELAVHPDGQVDELAGRPVAPAPGAARPARVSAQRGARAPLTRGGGRRGRVARRLLGAGAVVALLGSAVAVVMATTGGEDKPSAAPRVTAPAVKTTPAAVALAKQRDEAQQRAAAKDRRDRAVKKRAVTRRAAARRRAVRAKRAARRRAARRRAIATRRRAGTARQPAPAAPAQPAPQRPAPPPPPPLAAPCGEFDLC